MILDKYFFNRKYTMMLDKYFFNRKLVNFTKYIFF